MKDFSGQGKIYLGMRDPVLGSPQALQWVGDADQLQIKFSATTEDRQESWSGQRLPSVHFITAKKAALSLQLNEFSAVNLALALYGNNNTITTGTVTAETLPSNVSQGDTWALDNRDVSAVVITDSTPTTPKTLVLGTDYVVASAASGLIQFLSLLTGFVQPFKVAYSYAAAVQVPLFMNGMPERYLVMDGINTVDNTTVRVRLFRCVFDPASQLDLISAKLAQLTLSGSVLYDTINAQNSNMGGFGRIEMQPDAAVA